MQKKLVIYAALVSAMVFWGFSFVWTKEVFLFYKPLTTIFLRLLLSVVFLLVLNIWLKRLKKVKREDFKTVFILAFFEPFLYFLGENFGLSKVSSIVAAIIVATIPLFTPLGALFAFKERIPMMNLLGLLISIPGVYLVLVKPDLSFDASIAGILLLFLAVLSTIGYTIYIVKISEKYNVYTLITYQNIIGSVLFLPLVLIFELDDIISVGFQPQPLFPLVCLALFASTLSFIMFMHGVKNLGINKANVFANMIPIFTTVFAFFVLGEVPNWLNIVGIAIVIFGLFLSQINRKRIVSSKWFVLIFRKKQYIENIQNGKSN